MWNYTKIVMAKSMFKLAMAFNQDLPSSLVLSCRVCETTHKKSPWTWQHIKLHLPCSHRTQIAMLQRKTWQHIIYLHGNTTLLLVLWQHIMEKLKSWVAMATKNEKVWHFDKNNTEKFECVFAMAIFSIICLCYFIRGKFVKHFSMANGCKIMSWQIVLNLCHGKICIFFHDQHSS